MYSNRSFTALLLRRKYLHTARAAKLAENRSPCYLWREADMSPALGAPTAQRRQTTLRFEGRLGLSGLPPPEFGSPTGGLSPCHGSQALCRPERRLRRLPAIGPLASANRSPWLQELIRHCTRIYCCLPRLKISTRRYHCHSGQREKKPRSADGREEDNLEHLEHLECSHQPHIQGRGAKKRTQRAG